MKNHNILFALLVALGIACPAWFAVAQVPASPPAFSHYSRSWNDAFNDLFAGAKIDRVSMGRDRFVSLAVADEFSASRLVVLDSSFHLAFAKSPDFPYQGSRSYSAISTAREVWYVVDYQNESYVTLFSEQGAILNQFKLPGIKPNALIADTLGKVYLFANAGSTGFAMIRFSNASTVDFANWYPIFTTGGSFELGNDGRFYVPTTAGWLSLDRDGNPLRVQTFSGFGTGGRAQVYHDHGHAILQQGPGRTVDVVRTDSNMVVQWAERITLSPPYLLDSTVESLRHVVMPQSNEILVSASIALQAYYTTNCNITFDQQYLRLLGIRGDGTLSARFQQMPLTMKAINQGALTTSPFGEALLLGLNQHCVLGAYTQQSLSAHQFVLGGLTPECGTDPMDGMTITPLSIPNGSNVPASVVPSPLTVSLVPVAIPILAATHSNASGSVCHPPCANLHTITPLGGGQVQFSDSVYGFHQISYAFGDGGTASTTDPIHTYPGPGNYPVTLVATNECGGDTVQLTVDPCLSADMNAPAIGCVGLPSTFSQATTFPADSIEWLLNGVGQVTGNTFSFTPTAMGTVTIGIVYHDFPCLDTTSLLFNVTGSAPVPAFSYTVGSNNTVTFTNLSTGATNYSWDFGDGGSSTLAQPSHVYANSGTFTVCLTATNSCGVADTCDTLTCTFAQAGFVASVSGSTLTLQDQSVGANSVSWSFGDGGTGTGASVTHTYTASGNYTVCQYAVGNCGVDTLCQTISVVVNQRQFFRIAYSGLGIATPRGQATNHRGETCIVGNCTNGEFMLVIDSTGAVQSLKYLPSSSYLLNDVCATPNGDFLVVGGSTAAGPSQMNGLWLLVSPAGTILDKQVIGTGSAERYLDVKPARYGGYILSGTMNSANGFYCKLNAGMQLEWTQSSFEPAFAGFQVADSSYWMVQWRQGEWRFIHLSTSGVAFDEYSLAASSNSLTAGFAATEADAVMDCNGKIFVTAPISEFSFFNFTDAYNQGIYTFDTQTLTGNGKTIAHSINGATLNSDYEFFPRDMCFLPSGNLVSVGQFYPQGNPNGGHLSEQFITTFTPGMVEQDFYMGTFSTNDRLASVSILPTGAVLTSGDVDGTLVVRKYLQNSNCSIFSSTDAGPVSNPFNSFGFQGSPSNLVAGTTAVPNPIPVAAVGTGALQCSSPCTGAAVQAGFTVSIVGNTATLTSTSTPGASLFWNVPTMNCAYPGNQVSFPVGCGTYNVSLTAGNGCVSDTFATTISIPGGMGNPSLQPNLLQDTTVCQTGAVTLSAAPGYTNYAWSNGSTTSTTSTLAPDTLSLLAQLPNGCYVTDTATITLAALTAPALGANTSLCPGVSMTLDAGPGYGSYLWSTNATSQTITVNAPGTYTVTVSNGGGCQAADTIVITGLTAPSVNLGPDLSACSGNPVLLDAGGGFSAYAWSPGGATQFYSVTSSGTYTVTVTDANGCQGTDAITVTILPAVAVSLGPNLSICPGNSATLNAGSGFSSYAWNTGAQTQTITATQPGLYTVTVTNANGCQGQDSIVLGQYTVPAIQVSADTSFCQGGSAVLTASGAFSSFQWNTGATQPSITVTASGMYSVTATDANGCTATGATNVIAYNLPTVNLGPDTNIVAGSSLQLNAGTGFAQYQWSTGWMGPNILLTTAGTYWVQVTDSNGCTATDSIVVGIINGVDGAAARMDLRLSPVPTDALLRIDLFSPVDAEFALEVLDLHGRVVQLGNLSGGGGTDHMAGCDAFVCGSLPATGHQQRYDGAAEIWGDSLNVSFKHEMPTTMGHHFFVLANHCHSGALMGIGGRRRSW